MAENSRVTRESRRAIRHPVLLALTILLAPALWVYFVATVNAHELIVGCGAATLTVCFTIFVCRCSPTDISLRFRDLAQLLHLPVYIVSDALVISKVLLRNIFHSAPVSHSSYWVCGFDSSTHDPVRIGRTILAVAATTVSPNSIVIGIDPAQSRMLFHQIEPGPVSAMARALGAKP